MQLKRTIEKNWIVITIVVVILSLFLFGFVWIKGIPIPVIYDLSGNNTGPDVPDVPMTPAIPSSYVEVTEVDEGNDINVTPTEPQRTNISLDITPTLTQKYSNVVREPSKKQPSNDYTLVTSEFDSGIRNIGVPFKFYRQNTSGYKDLMVKYEVYDYKILPTGYEWRSEELQRYFYNLAPVGYDYLIIFVRAELDEAVDDNTMHLFGSSNFKIQVNGNVISEDEVYQKNIRIKELEDTYNKNHDYGIRPYGYDWAYVPVGTEISEASIDNGVIANKNGGIVAYPRFYLKSGYSNAEDGYIIYAIPEDRNDILVLGNFASFGNAAWILNTFNAL